MRRHLAMVCWHRTASETGRHTAHMSTAECHVQAYDQELRWNELMQTRWTRQDSHELHMHVHTQLFNGPLSGTTRVSCYQKIHSPTFSIYMPDSPFPQPLSKSSLVYLLVWNPLRHTPYISSSNQYLHTCKRFKWYWYWLLEPDVGNHTF